MQFAFTPKRRLGPMDATSDLLQATIQPMGMATASLELHSASEWHESRNAI